MAVAAALAAALAAVALALVVAAAAAVPLAASLAAAWVGGGAMGQEKQHRGVGGRGRSGSTPLGSRETLMCW